MQVFAVGQFDGLAETATAQSGLGKLSKLAAARALFGRLGLELASRSRVAVVCTKGKLGSWENA